jgi:uncharacterized protein UPF0158
MALPVKLKDVVDALEEAGDMISHYLDKRTGEIVMITEDGWQAVKEDELISEYPEWQRETILKAREIQSSDHFVQLPDQTDIHEYQIMERFARRYHDERTSKELLRSIQGKGAFRRFRDTVVHLNIRDEWNEFRAEEFEEIAVDWLEGAEIPYTREDEIEESSETM